MIYVSSLADLARHADTVRPSHVVSMLGDDAFPPTPAWLTAERHLRLRFHDIAEPLEGHVPPAAEHVEALIAFADAWARSGPVIVHCFAGVSRSTAAALIMLCRHNGGREAKAAGLLRQRAPHAQPNRLMVALADELMGCGGRLVAAVEAIGPGAYEGPPPLVELPGHLP